MKHATLGPSSAQEKAVISRYKYRRRHSFVKHKRRDTYECSKCGKDVLDQKLDKSEFFCDYFSTEIPKVSKKPFSFLQKIGAFQRFIKDMGQ
jgi:ribosomal protein L37AE/L43A